MPIWDIWVQQLAPNLTSTMGAANNSQSALRSISSSTGPVSRGSQVFLLQWILVDDVRKDMSGLRWVNLLLFFPKPTRPLHDMCRLNTCVRGWGFRLDLILIPTIREIEKCRLCSLTRLSRYGVVPTAFHINHKMSIKFLYKREYCLLTEVEDVYR